MWQNPAGLRDASGSRAIRLWPTKSGRPSHNSGQIKLPTRSPARTGRGDCKSFVVTKDAFDEMAPLSFIFVRFLLMTSLAFGVLLFSARGDRSQLMIQRSDLPRFIVVGLAGYTFYQLEFVFGV